MLNIERQVVAHEFASSLQLEKYSLKHMMSATQSCCYDIHENYEVLETLGDSVLKFIASTVLTLHFANVKGEDFLTDKRVEFISNNFLAFVAMKSDFHLFVKQQVYRYDDWISMILVNIEPNKELKIIFKTRITQLLGPFLIKHNLQIEYPISSTYIDLLDEKLFKLDEDNVKQINSQKLLFMEQIKSMNVEDTKFYSWLLYFQTNVLKYKFKNIYLLIEALTFAPFSAMPLNEPIKSTSFYDSFHRSNFGKRNYQNLEYLGDSILECFIIGNSFHQFERGNIQINPQYMHRVKTCLLTNYFMARVGLLLGFHLFIINLDPTKINEIDQFAINCDFTTQFAKHQKSNIPLPKILSDVWESLAAAILIDGGWDALMATYGQFYQSFISYTVAHIYEIEDPPETEKLNI